VRNPTKANDEFMTAYLHSWVVGSVTVVEGIYKFIKSKDADSFDKVLQAMRKDLTLSNEDLPVSEGDLKKLTISGLFPAPQLPLPEGGM
jgi:hypothetical protein